MIAELLDDVNLLITLQNDDVTAFRFSKADFVSQKKEWLILRQEIISLSLINLGLYPENKRLSIKTLPYDTGCFILVTVHDKKERKKYRILHSDKTILVHLRDPDTLLTVIKHLYDCKLRCISTLYYSDTDGYYLLIRTLPQYEKFFSGRLSEYGKVISADNLTISKLEETCKVVYSKKAIEYIGSKI